MTTTIYGIAGSRAIRSLWAIEEVGIEYEQVPTHFIDDSKTPEFLAINPNGRIPALVDGDVTLCESMAINLYLTKTYSPALYPQDNIGEATAIQWSFWAITEIEPLQLQIVVQKFFNRDNMDQAIIDSATESLQRPFKVLESHLANSDYLMGDSFNVADLNVAGVMWLMKMAEVDVSAYPNITAWLDRCHGRDALTRARALK